MSNLLTSVAMSDEQEEHLEFIQEEFCDLVDHKYRKGAAEHGGKLSDMPLLNLVENAIDEAIDQVTYLLTLRQKIDEIIK